MADDPKAIFAYKGADGRERKGDPAELLRRLTTCCGGDPNLLFAKAEYPRPREEGGPEVIPEGFDPCTSLEANERLARAVCTAFRLGQPWNDEAGAGVPESVWSAVLDSFLGFVQGEASGAAGEQNSAPPSAPESSACPTPNSSACG